MKRRELKNGFFFSNAVETDGGVELSGYFKIWGKVNGNGEEYVKTAYDDFIKSYYEENNLNIPVTLLHGGNFESLAGKVTEMIKDDVGLFIKVLISKGAVYHDKIKTLIEDKVLQGFSDDGWAPEWEDKGDRILIKKAVLMNMSLVTTPSEVMAGFEINNATKFVGFGKKEDITNKLSFLK